MATVTYIEDDGTEHVVAVEVGFTVMEAAVRNGVPGIVADCGGACACATCHCYVDAAWIDRVGEIGEQEAEMLDFAEDRRENSRLSCQIKVTEALDGLVVRTPASQG